MKGLCILALLLLSIVAARGDAAEKFASGGKEFAAGHFDNAIADYEEAANAGGWSANVFYDLGNAYYRNGNFGRAILNYRRALALDPHHPEAAANLRVARDEARALELPREPIEDALSFGTTNRFAAIGAAGFWLSLFSAVALAFRKRRTLAAPLMLTVGLLLFAGGGYATYASETGRSGRALAIVVADKIQARLATADNSGTVLALPPGSEVQVLSARGDWLYAALPNHLRGWIPAHAAELIRK